MGARMGGSGSWEQGGGDGSMNEGSRNRVRMGKGRGSKNEGRE